MGRHLAVVRFPGGEAKFTTYNGTSDILHPVLHPTKERAFEFITFGKWPAPPPVTALRAKVFIFTVYGGGFSWYGEATHDRVTAGMDPHGQDGDWGRPAVPPCEITDGMPLWAFQVLGDTYLCKRQGEES